MYEKELAAKDEELAKLRAGGSKRESQPGCGCVIS